MAYDHSANPSHDGAPDLCVPTALLAHDLGTPLNVLQGYTRLLASGALGPLDADAAAAVDAMREAVASLARTHGLLTAEAPTFEAAAPDIDLEPPLRAAWHGAGLRPEGTRSLALRGAAWGGWETLFHALLAASVVRGVERVVLTGSNDALEIRAEPARHGTGDDALAAWLARAHADRGLLRLVHAVPSGWRLSGSSIGNGSGHVVLAVPERAQVA